MASYRLLSTYRRKPQDLPISFDCKGLPSIFEVEKPSVQAAAKDFFKSFDGKGLASISWLRFDSEQFDYLILDSNRLDGRSSLVMVDGNSDSFPDRSPSWRFCYAIRFRPPRPPCVRHQQH